MSEINSPINPFDLLDKIDETWEFICDRYGMNVPYVESANASFFLHVIEASLTEDEKKELEELTPENDLLDTLRFMAEIDYIIPNSLKDASMEEFVSYLTEHKQEVYKKVFDVMDESYRDCKSVLDSRRLQ